MSASKTEVVVFLISAVVNSSILSAFSPESSSGSSSNGRVTFTKSAHESSLSYMFNARPCSFCSSSTVVFFAAYLFLFSDLVLGFCSAAVCAASGGGGLSGAYLLMMKKPFLYPAGYKLAPRGKRHHAPVFFQRHTGILPGLFDCLCHP